MAAKRRIVCKDGCRLENSLQEGERMEAERPVRCDVGQEQCGYRAGMHGSHVLGSLYPEWFLLDHSSPHKSFKKEKDMKSCRGSLSLRVPKSVLLDVT